MTHPGYEYPDLDHLFRAFFHADWAEEFPPGADWPDVIEAYVQDTPCWHLNKVIDQLDRLLAVGQTDEELEQTVYLLGSYYPFNRESVTAIRDRVQRYIDTHPDDEVPPERETTGA